MLCLLTMRRIHDTDLFCFICSLSFVFVSYLPGINVRKGTISDMYAEHVIQPVLVNSSALKLATECVGMILKIDDVVAVM